MLQSVNCGARITCLALALPYMNVLETKQEEVEEEKKVERKSTLRLKQEVIIEDEGEEETINVLNCKIKTKHVIIKIISESK